MDNSPIRSETVQVAAKFSALASLLGPLTRPSPATGVAVDANTLLRAQTAVEELFANSVHHGYGGESEQPVWLTVESRGTVLHVIYADAAAAFDPFASLQALTDIEEISIGARRVGGLGRLLVRELADRCVYRYCDGRNVTELEFHPRAPIQSLSR